jgi:hypothetical protein
VGGLFISIQYPIVVSKNVVDNVLFYCFCSSPDEHWTHHEWNILTDPFFPGPSEADAANDNSSFTGEWAVWTPGESCEPSWSDCSQTCHSIDWRSSSEFDRFASKYASDTASHVPDEEAKATAASTI